MKKILYGLLVFLVIFSINETAQALQIKKVVLCENVEKLEPVDPKTSFDHGQRAYCWMRVADATVGSQVLVDWFYNDTLQYTAKLDLPYTTMRTYTYKTLHSNGKWRADIKDADGNLLKSMAFGVGEDYVSNDVVEVETDNIVIEQVTPVEDEKVTPEVDQTVDEMQNDALIILPEDFDPDTPYPVLVALPYTGGTAAGLMEEYPGIKDKPLILMITRGYGSAKDHDWQGFAKAVKRYEKHLGASLRNLGSKYNIDKKSVYLIGYSLGGDLSWLLCLKHAPKLKGAIIMGSRCSYAKSGSLKKLADNDSRFYIAMGEHENTDRLKGAQYAKKRLEGVGVKHIYYEIPNSGHDILPEEKMLEAIDFVMFDNVSGH